MAEASRAREDLKECIQYIVKLKTKNSEEDSRQGSTVTASMSTQRNPEPDVFATPKKSSDHAVSARPRRSEFSKNGNTDRATPSTQESGATQQSELFHDDHSVSSFSSDGHPRRRCSEPRNLALCFWTQRGKETVDKGPAFERMMDDSAPRRAPMLGRRQKKQKKAKDKPLSTREGKRSKIPKLAKVTKLNQSLAEADREADELRTRLHSITRYYDTIVVSLQQNAGSRNTDNAEFEADMINQLSFLDREKRAVIAELRQKDALVTKHQKEITKVGISSKDGRNGIPIQERASFA